MAGSDPPALIEVVAGKWLEAMHAETERPALVGLMGCCSCGGVGDAEHLGRSGGVKRDDDCGYRWAASGKAERDDDGGDDGSSSGGYDSWRDALGNGATQAGE